jgi:hypothetical protein
MSGGQQTLELPVPCHIDVGHSGAVARAADQLARSGAFAVLVVQLFLTLCRSSFSTPHPDWAS